jgi:hypothetical protein
LWGIATLFSNSFAGMPFIFYDEVRKQRELGNRVRAAWYLMWSVFCTGLWIGLVAYCGYRTYLAIP